MASSLYFDYATRELNTKLKPQLHSVHEKLIQLDDDVTKRNVAVLETLLNGICKEMKLRDSLFKQVFNRLVYTGSYYEGLRTREADEFDINIVLDLPFRKSEVTWLQGCPGYIGYSVSPTALYGGGLVDRIVSAWTDNYRLMPDRVKRWLQSVFDRAIQTYRIPSGLCKKIWSSVHGPANTIHVLLQDDRRIDVDLVPVIEFRHPDWPPGIRKKNWMTKVPEKYRNWFLVPKTPTPMSCLWRLHFPNLENELIADFGCVKPIIRLLKATRDSHKWNLSSYALKTFVMRQVLENYHKQYWHPDNQGTLFVTVLDRLGRALGQPGTAIPFLFDPKLDLIEKVTRVNRENMSGEINRIVRRLQESPCDVRVVFPDLDVHHG